MTAAASSRAAWRKSSHSGANGDCIEVARPATGRSPSATPKTPAAPGSPSPPVSGRHSRRAESAQLCRFPVDSSDSRASFPPGYGAHLSGAQAGHSASRGIHLTPLTGR